MRWWNGPPTVPEQHRPRHHLHVGVTRISVAVVLVGLLGLLVVLITTFTWLQEVSFRWMGLAGVALPTAAALAAVTTLAAVLAALSGPPRRRRSVALVLAMLASWSAVVAIAAPTLRGMVSPRPPGEGTELTVLSQNLWYENTEPDATAAAVMSRDADVMVLVEYTPAHAAAFRRAGVRSRYPYRWEEPGDLGGGLAVMSKVPFGDIDRIRTWSGAVRVELMTRSAPVTLYAVHPVAPSDNYGLRRWKGDYRVLTETLRGTGPSTVVAGDFNATGSHRRFRQLMSVAGLSDAQDISGAGFGATWPANGVLPPIMRLDHVLIGDGIGVAGVEVLDDVGADHRGVEARLRIPPS